MKLLYWLVKNKANAKSEAPIYCRVTINGKRAEINTGINAKPNEWDNVRKKVKGNSELVVNRNRKLERLSHKLQNLFYTESLNSDRLLSAMDIKILHQNKRNNIYLLTELLQEYCDECYKMYSKLEKLGQHQRYIVCIKSALKRLHKSNIHITECDTYFFDLLAHDLAKSKGYAVSYVKKIFSFLKAALMYAFNRRYVDRIYGLKYSVPYTTKSEIIYLDEMEVAKIEKHLFDEYTQRSVDAFLIQCYTGLSYVDLKNLGPQHLQQDKGGVVWINITRQKVQGAECMIPVISRAWTILKKYDFTIPLITNQRYNVALKRMSKEIGIHKNVTSHVGRKTYGTLLLNKDVPIETVSSLLGHSNIRITQKHYAKVLHMKIARDIRAVM